MVSLNSEVYFTATETCFAYTTSVVYNCTYISLTVFLFRTRRGPLLIPLLAVPMVVQEGFPSPHSSDGWNRLAGAAALRTVVLIRGELGLQQTSHQIDVDIRHFGTQGVLQNTASLRLSLYIQERVSCDVGRDLLLCLVNSKGRKRKATDPNHHTQISN